MIWRSFVQRRKRRCKPRHSESVARDRGLRLSDEKTHIRHLREGFNFLAFISAIILPQ